MKFRMLVFCALGATLGSVSTAQAHGHGHDYVSLSFGAGGWGAYPAYYPGYYPSYYPTYYNPYYGYPTPTYPTRIVVYQQPSAAAVPVQPKVIQGSNPPAYAQAYIDDEGRTCRQFESVMDGEPVNGTACLQPDGTWRTVAQ